MRRAQDRARSARSRKNGARSATIKSRAPGALKLARAARDENVPVKRADFFSCGCLPTLRGSSAPVFSQCRPSAVPTLGTLLFGNSSITLELQPERYRAGCKDWQYTDFSAWIEEDLTSSRGKRLQ